MKTSLDIPDALLRQAKSQAALQGKSMRDFFVEAVEAKLKVEAGLVGQPRGWRTVFGKGPKGAARRVQAVVDREFESINLDEWR